MSHDDRAPDDFTAFVVRNASKVQATCRQLTGSEALADRLAREVLASLALRWRWLRRGSRSPAAARLAAADRRGRAYVAKLLRYESRSWEYSADLDTALASTFEGETVPDFTIGQVTSGDRVGERRLSGLAADAWGGARRIRRRRRLGALAVVALLGVLALLGRHPSETSPPPPQVSQTRQALPSGLHLLPSFAQLTELDPRQLSMPANVDVSPLHALPLAANPVERALALIRAQEGTVVLVAPDGTTRSIDDQSLSDVWLVATSLSPDGTRAALLGLTDLIVIDIPTSTIRRWEDRLEQERPDVRALAWISPTAVVVPAVAGGIKIDTLTGAVTVIPGIDGLNVAQSYGRSVPLVELLGARDGAAARIRVWQDNYAAPAADRTIRGPSWVGQWTGPTWAAGSLVVRACSPARIELPTAYGLPRAAVAAVSQNGRTVATLVATEQTVLEILGFADTGTVIVAANAPQTTTILLAWSPFGGDIRLVSTLTAAARISLSDPLASG